MRQEADSRDVVMQSEISNLYFFKENEDGREMVTEDEERVFRGGWTEIG